MPEKRKSCSITLLKRSVILAKCTLERRTWEGFQHCFSECYFNKSCLYIALSLDFLINALHHLVKIPADTHQYINGNHQLKPINYRYWTYDLLLFKSSRSLLTRDNRMRTKMTRNSLGDEIQETWHFLYLRYLTRATKYNYESIIQLTTNNVIARFTTRLSRPPMFRASPFKM